MHGTVHVPSGLKPGAKYELCRFEGTADLPTADGNGCTGAKSRVPFRAATSSWTHHVLQPILSDTAVYFRVFPA